MNCRDCKNMDVRSLINAGGKWLAKQGHGRCSVTPNILPIAGYWCEKYEPAPQATVQARETFWKIR